MGAVSGGAEGQAGAGAPAPPPSLAAATARRPRLAAGTVLGAGRPGPSEGAVAAGRPGPATGASLRDRVRRGLARLAGFLDRSLEQDRDAGRLFLWLPVAFAVGVGLYHGLVEEPDLGILAGAAAVALAAAVAVRGRPRLGPLAVVLATVALAATAAAVEVRLAAAPILERPRVAVVTGRIERVERRERGRDRLTVRVAAADGLGRGALPKRVAVTAARSAVAVRVGDGAVFRARLAPPPGPLAAGGYDPARAAYLDGIGATGFVLGGVAAADLGPAPVLLRLTAAVDRARGDLAARVRAELPGAEGEIAAALLVGDRGAIPEALEEAMRVSGLAHVLSISGLHMVLVAGTVMFVVRALLALVPGLALTRPIKLWAAAAAAAAATGYLVLSGAEVATQRSYVTLIVGLAAVAVGRQAISLRTVAIAALVVMAIAPSAVLGAGFQMSFAAVVALVAVYERFSLRLPGEDGVPRRGILAAAARGAVLAVAGVAVTSLVAGLATAPIAAYHFHRAAPLGLLANLAAMPAVSLLVMPAAVAALALAPFGLEWLALPVMGAGIAAMNWVAVEVAAWSGGFSYVGRIPAASVVLLAAALLFAAIAVAPWRVLALVPAVAGLALLPFARVPDVIVAESGATVAVRQADGSLAVLRGRGDAAVVRRWLAADADGRAEDDPGLAAAFRCDPLGCVAALPEGGLLAVARSGLALAEDCARARIVVAPVDDVGDCRGPALVLTPRLLSRRGVTELVLGGDGSVAIAAVARRGARPWQPVAADAAGGRAPPAAP